MTSLAENETFLFHIHLLFYNKLKYAVAVTFAKYKSFYFDICFGREHCNNCNSFIDVKKMGNFMSSIK